LKGETEFFTLKGEIEFSTPKGERTDTFTQAIRLVNVVPPVKTKGPHTPRLLDPVQDSLLQKEVRKNLDAGYTLGKRGPACRNKGNQNLLRLLGHSLWTLSCKKK
jgi:hypothetical protein